MAASTTPAEELEMVERLLTRLALTEDVQLEKVLSKLLPYAISLMGSSNNPTRVKVTEMLSHINKRVKDRLTIKLPLVELLKLYKGQDANFLVKNFSLIYIEMAFDRSPFEEKISIVPDFLGGLSSLPPLHQDVFLRLSAKALEQVASDQIYENLATKLKASLLSPDYPILVEFCIQSMFYHPPSASQAGEAVPPAGLSLAQATRISGKTLLKNEQLVPRKIGLLNLVSKLELEPKILYPLYLVATSDSNEQVARRGEELLKKKASGVNLEDTALVKRLFSIFQGSPDSQGMVVDAKVFPAGPALKARVLGVLTHSVAAANTFPMTLQCIFECLYGKATTSRLKQAGMEFTVWVFKHASNEQLKLMAPIILSNFVKLLDTDETELSLKPSRAFAYQAIGQLSQRAPQFFSGNTDMAKRLFRALQTEDPSIRFTIQEALSALATAYQNCSPAVGKEIENLLMENLEALEGETRFCAVFWATKIYEPSHVASRYLCMLAAGDSKLDVREMSLEGLKVSRFNTEESTPDSSSYPSFKDLIMYICEKKPAILSPSVVGERVLIFPPKVYAAMVSFVMKCYEFEHQRDADNTAILQGVSPESALRLLLEHGMAYDGTAELHALCSAGLLTLASKDPKRFAEAYVDRIQWLNQFLGNIDMNTRENVSRLLGVVTCRLNPTQTSDLLQKLVSSFDGVAKGRFEDLHGAICSTGYILAQCRTGTPAVSDELQGRATTALIRLLTAEKPLLGAFAAEALGHAGLRGPLPIPLGDISSCSNSSQAGLPEGDESLTTLVTHLKALLSAKETKVVQKSVIAFGHLCFGNPLPELLDISITSLFELRKSKVEDVLLAVGEAIAFIWGIIPITADRILQSNFVSLSHSTNFLSDDPACSGNSDPEILQTNDIRTSFRERIVKVLLDELIFSSRKEERCAGSVWLLSLVSYCGRHYKIQALLPRIQEAFSYLLGEQNELTQEMASRGMSIVFELGDAATREELVKALVSTLSGTAKKKRPIKLMEDSEVFEAGTIGEAPSGGNISTYKELCNLANEMGQPDLVYKFMDLANYQTSLNSKRGAAFGFAKIAKRAGDALEPHLRSLVPKLYRYQHDPNKNIQDAMGHIWRSLVADPKNTIDLYFEDIMEDLVTNAGSRYWRSRESACLALADIIQGRKFTEVEKYLLKIWTVAFRAMDDIKESVRNAGSILCRAVSSLTSRLCDTSLTSDLEARATMAIVLPFLLSSGIASSVSEIQQTSIRMVMKLVKSAGPAIRPQLPELVVCMLESLSSLEDQRLNYAELHADRLGLSTDKLDNARFSLAKDSPMWETLDFCLRQVDQQTLELVVPRLAQLVRSGVGLNTRAGVARFIALLAQQVGADIRQYAGVLLKVLIPTVISEKSTAARRAFAAACAAVMRFSGDRLLQQQFVDIVGFYKSGDKDSRIASGLLLKELSRQASDCLKDYHTLVLPVAFIARFDEDKSVSSDFEEVWEENTSSETVALQLYMPEIVPLLLDGLVASSWTQKQQSAKAVIRVSEVAGEAIEPCVQQLLTNLLNELPGRLWEGKECILDAIAAVCKGCPKAFVTSQQQAGFGSRVVVEAVIAASLRKKSSFRAAAYSCLEKLVEAFKDADLFDVVAPAVLEEIFAKNTSDSGKSATDEPSKVPLDKAFACLTASLRTGVEPTISAHAENIIAAVVTGLNATSWQVKLAALVCAQAFAQRCPAGLLKEEMQEGVISPILDCISNVKVSQVHISALECLKEILGAISASGSLTPKITSLVEGRLRELQAPEKNANGRSLISDMIGLLTDSSSKSMAVD